MKHRNQMKRTYRSPLSSPTEVAFEQALLVTTGTLLLEVDPLDNMNTPDDDGHAVDGVGSDLYFEF